MKREQRNGWGKNAWVIGLLLTPACGGEPLGETSNLEGSDEVVARTEEAAQSVNDVPVAVFARPFIVGTGYSQFTFVIDSDRHLLRNVMYPGENPVTRGWDTVATGLVGVPTAVGYFFSDSQGNVTSSIDVFGRSSGGNLWEYFFPTASDVVSEPFSYNISDISGFRAQYGKIAGSPVIVDYGGDGSAVSVIVQAESDHSLYSLDWTARTDWLIRPVTYQGATVQSANAVASWDAKGTFGGRGLTASDDSTSWIAKRATYHDFSLPFEVTVTWAGGSGTPDTGKQATLARFGNELKVVQNNGTIGGGTCDVRGSPLGDWGTSGTFAAARGTNGHLIRIGGSSTTFCKDLGENLTSAPNVEPHSLFAYFRGGSGSLHARNLGGTASWGFDIWLP